MFNRSLKISITAVAAICLSVATAQQSKADTASCPSPIPFGLTTALTGNLALLGTQARNGVEFAVDEINAGGGIAGKQLALSTEDTGASSTDALNAMNRILGEQQMLAIGRALMSRPSLLMLDEPSLGLAPIVIEQVFDRIVELNKRTGLGVLLVEQNSAMALEIASRAFVLETGMITLSGPSAILANDPRIREAYLGG
jgi:ABC-type hemin transport system ATPase subunit